MRVSNRIYDEILNISNADWIEWQGINDIVLTGTKAKSLKYIYFYRRYKHYKRTN